VVEWRYQSIDFGYLTNKKVKEEVRKVNRLKLSW